MKILRENLRKEVKLGRLTRGGFSRLPILLLRVQELRNCLKYGHEKYKQTLKAITLF